MSAASAWLDPRPRNRALLAALVVSCTALAYAARAPQARAFVGAGVAATLVLVAVTDLERRVIPNRVVLPATVAVLAAQTAISPRHAVICLLCAVLATAFFAIPGLLSPGAVGMGDAKLALLLGATLGRDVVIALVVGLLAVFPVALLAVIRDGWGARKAHLPLGPFLAAGGLVVLIAPLL